MDYGKTNNRHHILVSERFWRKRIADLFSERYQLQENNNERIGQGKKERMGTLDLPTMTMTKWIWNECIRDTCGRSPGASQLQIDHQEHLRYTNTLLDIAGDTCIVQKHTTTG